jgi:hypothetical protein
MLTTTSQPYPAFRRPVVVLALLLSVLLAAVAVPQPARAADKATVVINAGFASRASYTGKGGILGPSFSVLPCGTEENEKVRLREFTVTVSKKGKTVKTTHRQMDLIRLDPGTYGVRTKLRYSYRGVTTTKTKSQTIKVTRKTDATSVSDGEFRAIKRGMTLARVRSIVGGRGAYEYGYFFMDALQFEHSVGVQFEEGRVIDKWRTQNVYDWC